jgi:hypothetical protein
MTDAERAALVERVISAAIVEVVEATIAAIEPAIRADERARVVEEATADEAVERATAVHFDGQPDRVTYNRVRRQTRAAIRAALGVGA